MTVCGSNSRGSGKYISSVLQRDASGYANPGLQSCSRLFGLTPCLRSELASPRLQTNKACMLSAYSFGQSTMSLAVVHKEIPSSATYALRHSVLWPNIPLSEQGLPDDDQPGVRHYGSYLDDDVVSILTFLPPTEHREIQFRKLATAHAYQSRGIGSSLLRYAMDQVLARERGEVLIWCNARTTALAFYGRFGLKPLLPEGAEGRGYTKYGEGGKAIEYVRIGGLFEGRASS